MPHTEVRDWQESSGLELEMYYNPCMVEAGNSVGGRVVVVGCCCVVVGVGGVCVGVIVIGGGSCGGVVNTIDIFWTFLVLHENFVIPEDDNMSLTLISETHMLYLTIIILSIIILNLIFCVVFYRLIIFYSMSVVLKNS